MEVTASCGWVAEMVGALMPMAPVNHQYMITAPIAGREIPRDTPVLRDPDNLVYIREEVGGFLVGGFETEPVAWNPSGVPWEHSRTALAPDWDQFEQVVGASILVRAGRIGDELGFLSNIAIWPIWDVAGGLVPGEASEIANILPLARQAQLVGGIVMRPVAFNSRSTSEVAGNALVLTLGTDSAALREGLGTLQTYLASCLVAEEV